MRLTTIPFLITSAGLVAQYVAASPVRVVVVANHEVSANIRYIDPTHNAGPLFPLPPLPNTVEEGAGQRRPCHGIKDKALQISNKFREAFGLPTIDPDVGRTDVSLPSPPADFRILPFVPMGYNAKGPVMEDSPFNKEGGVVRIGGPGHFHRMGGPRHHRFHPSFLHRVHRALMILGPWEGRAVAFVLGCGIGVLLRMMWVMTIVMFRAFKGGRRSEDDEIHDVLIFEADAEQIFVAPPEYTDEKVALVAVEQQEQDNKA